MAPLDRGLLDEPSDEFKAANPGWGTVEIDPDAPDAAVIAYLDVHLWAARDIPPPDKIFGELVTTTTRMFLVGRTGLGKTLLGMAMAYAAACGKDFMHWACARPVRVLYIDGEMPAELIKLRALEILRKEYGPAEGNLLIFAADTMEEFQRLFPSMAPFQPLNTEGGQQFVKDLLKAVGGADLVIFDNVMSLVVGDQKDEVPWSETLPLVSWLTSQRIGQIWLDHTGHNTDRQYGSATKAWRMDAVGLMTPVEGGGRDEVAFTLSFDHPGKARRRTPANWQDFQTCAVRLVQGEWLSEPAEKADAVKVSPSRRVFHDHLISAVNGSGQATIDQWEKSCIHRGSMEPGEVGETFHARDKRKKLFRTAKGELLAAKWISINGEVVTDLRSEWGTR